MFAGLDIPGMVARSTASGWLLCAIGLTGLFGIWRVYAMQRTRMTELRIGEATGLRQEFIEEMQALRDEVKGLRDENAQLRKEIRELHGVIDGMRRENLSAQLSGQRVVAEALPHSAEIDRAIDTLSNIKRGGE